MLQETPDSPYALNARYGLAMTLVAADNPQKDYAQALHEFETFYKLYPEERRTPEVLNWIAVLKTLSDRNRSIEQLKQLDIRHEERRRK
jgi:TolA-binding protein